MIQIADGWAVERLLRRAHAHPECYRRLFICVPFIDARSEDLLAAIAARAARVGCAMVVATTPAEACRLRKRLRDTAQLRATVVGRPRLHAKVYLLEGRRPEDNEAIVTSANLTDSGLRGGTELGVRAIPTSKQGLAFYYQAVRQMRCDGHLVRQQRSGNERDA